MRLCRPSIDLRLIFQQMVLLMQTLNYTVLVFSELMSVQGERTCLQYLWCIVRASRSAHSLRESLYYWSIFEKMLKCIYRQEPIDNHCDEEAEYIYLGKSYCKKHMEIRSKDFLPQEVN